MKYRADQERVLRELEREWSERANHPIYVAGVLTDWDEFTREVAEGYQSGIYDYENELSAREMIAELGGRLGGLPPAMAQRVVDSDERFRAATTSQGRPIGMSPREAMARPDVIKPDRWWWFRRPVRAGPELAQDLEGEERGQ
jgi:ABC-type nitrate/sulfonate/bicarbonate transport system substrate-binding protein